MIVPKASPRFSVPLLLLTALSLLAGCGSNSSAPPDIAAAEEDAPYADSVGRDYVAYAPEFVRGNEYQEGHVTLNIDQGSNRLFASDAREISAVSADVPMGVNITRAVLSYDDLDAFGRLYRLAVECAVEERLICRFEGDQFENVSLEIDYKIFVPGDHEFSAFIDTRGSDPEPGNNAPAVVFRYVASTRYLQSLLDATKPNGSVTLPSGTYMGTLHGGDRMLTVQGADDGDTVLLSDNLDMPLLEHIGTGSTFSNLELRSSGAAVLVRSGHNITIRDSLIAPIQGAWHDLSQLFASNSYRLLFSRVEGWGGDSGRCRSLLYAGPHSSNTMHSGIYIQNTLFHDNACDDLLLDSSTTSFSSDPDVPVENVSSRLFILNNTFVNNQGRIEFSGNGAIDVQIRNNIFVAHEDPIVLPRVVDQGGMARLVLARNLVWDSPFDSLAGADVAAGQTVRVESPDLIADPLFANSDDGDFSLATGSPAIDAGAVVDAYFWIDPKSGAVVVPPVRAREPTPVDGLLDGNAIMDIGAFEYSPG